MLNRQLVRKGLFTNGLLLLISIVATAGIQYPGDSMRQRSVDSSIQWLKFDTEMLELTGIPEMGILNAPAIPLNKQGMKFVKDYLAQNGRTLEKIKERSPSYFAVMDSVFTRFNLPLELKYLAVVESELKTTALSRVGARGAWQLMPVTARILSLKVNGKYDERTHLYKSTVAAAKYLNDLYDIYGDWLLVIAAYNSGPGNVNKAIRKSGSRSFWKMQAFLPEETRKHVKKFIGTHYFFEGEGGVTTLTKDEVTLYSKTMIAFVAKHNLMLEEKFSTTSKEEQPKEEKTLVSRSNAELYISSDKQQGAKGIVE